MKKVLSFLVFLSLVTLMIACGEEKEALMKVLNINQKNEQPKGYLYCFPMSDTTHQVNSEVPPLSWTVS